MTTWPTHNASHASRSGSPESPTSSYNSSFLACFSNRKTSHHFLSFRKEKRNWEMKGTARLISCGRRQYGSTISEHSIPYHGKKYSRLVWNFSIKTACRNRISVMAGRSEKEKYEILRPFMQGLTYPPRIVRRQGCCSQPYKYNIT